MAARRYLSALKPRDEEHNFHTEMAAFLSTGVGLGEGYTPPSVPTVPAKPVLPISERLHPSANSFSQSLRGDGPPPLSLPDAVGAQNYPVNERNTHRGSKRSEPSGTPNSLRDSQVPAERNSSSPVRHDTVVVEEYRTIDKHLEKRLGDVKAVVDEFFDDVDLMIVEKSKETLTTNSRLNQFASAIRRVPLLSDKDWQLLPDFKRRVKKHVAKKKTMSQMVHSIVNKVKNQYRLTLDISMVVLAGVSIVLMIIADTLLWKVPDVSSASSSAVNSTSAATMAPGANATAGNATNPPTAAPIVTYTPAPYGRSSIENDLGGSIYGTVVILHYLMFFIGLIFIIVVSLYYRHKLNEKRAIWSKVAGKQVIAPSQAYSFFRSSMFVEYLTEVVVFMVMPYPWYNQLYSQNAKYLQIFMFARCYLVFRLMYHNSNIFVNRAQVLRHSEFLRRAGFYVSFVDAMKVYFFEYTILTASLLYIGVVFIGGFCVFVAERNFNSSSPDDPTGILGFSSFFSGVYFMVISIRTIGYGDLQAKTIVGRAITIVFQFTGVTVESLIASVVVNKIAKSKEEKIVDEYLESFASWSELRVRAAMVIQAFWKTCRRYKFLHRKETKENMELLRRAMVRRLKYLNMLQQSRARSAVEDTTTGGTSLDLRDEENKTIHDAMFKQIVRHFASAKNIKKTRRSEGAMFGVYSAQTSLEEERDELLERMPYVRDRESAFSTQDLIDKDRHLFTQNIDMIRWNKNIGDRVPRGFKLTRKFTSTRKVIRAGGAERRIPIGKGHKADIRLEALQKFRKARLKFKTSIAPSSDHVIDSKLQIAYELLVAASKKLRRNIVLLQTLKRTSRLEINSMKQTMILALSGGIAAPADYVT